MEQVRIWLQTAAIIVALGVFLTREGLEYRRRQRSKLREVAAIKIVLARACELNNWTAKMLRDQLNTIANSKNPTTEISIRFLQGGRIRFVEAADNGEAGSSIIPEVYADDFKGQLLSVAKLDATLTPLLEGAITGLAELHHVRDSMIRYLSGEDGPGSGQPPDSGFLKDFAEYGLEELGDAYEALSALYTGCTGTELKSHRLR